MAVIHATIRRMKKLRLDSAAIKKETLVIQSIADLNGLKVDFKMSLRRQSLRTILTSSSRQLLPPPLLLLVAWIRLPFLGRLSSLLAKELERFNYKVGFYPLTSVSSLSRLKDRIPDPSQSGVYKLTCGVCTAEYVGKTGRPFDKRLKEYRNDYNNLNDGTSKKKCSDLSAMALHCHQDNDHFDNVTSRLIHRKGKGCTLNSLEQVETLTAIKEATGSNKQILNDVRYTLSSPLSQFYLDDSRS